MNEDTHPQTQEVLTTIAIQLSHGLTDPSELASALEKFEDDAVRDGLEILDAMLRGVIEAR